MRNRSLLYQILLILLGNLDVIDVNRRWTSPRCHILIVIASLGLWWLRKLLGQLNLLVGEKCLFSVWCIVPLDRDSSVCVRLGRELAWFCKHSNEWVLARWWCSGCNCLSQFSLHHTDCFVKAGSQFVSIGNSSHVCLRTSSCESKWFSSICSVGHWSPRPARSSSRQQALARVELWLCRSEWVYRENWLSEWLYWMMGMARPRCSVALAIASSSVRMILWSRRSGVLANVAWML